MTIAMGFAFAISTAGTIHLACRTRQVFRQPVFLGSVRILRVGRPDVPGLDTIFDYSVEDEVVDGIKKLGLDPANIKYAIVSHPHSDHDGGARYLQNHSGTRGIMSPAAWDLLDKRTVGTKPRRDIEATDGQKLTLGEETVTLHILPGHTPGTNCSVFPVNDNGTPHVAALWA